MRNAKTKLDMPKWYIKFFIVKIVKENFFVVGGMKDKRNCAKRTLQYFPLCVI